MNFEPLKPILNLLFNNDSEFFITRGLKGVGKTNLNLLLMEASAEHGYFKRYCGNVEIQNQSFDYTVIRDLQTLKLFSKAGKGKVFCFVDELGKNAPKGTPWAKLNIELLRSLEVIRKYKLTIASAFIGNSVSDMILSPSYLDAWFDKYALDKATLHDYRHRRVIQLRNIPKSSITYEEYQDVSFTDKPTVNQNVSWASSADIELYQKSKSGVPLDNLERKQLSRLRAKGLEIAMSMSEVTPRQIELVGNAGETSHTQA